MPVTDRVGGEDLRRITCGVGAHSVVMSGNFGFAQCVCIKGGLVEPAVKCSVWDSGRAETERDAGVGAKPAGAGGRDWPGNSLTIDVKQNVGPIVDAGDMLPHIVLNRAA